MASWIFTKITSEKLLREYKPSRYACSSSDSLRSRLACGFGLKCRNIILHPNHAIHSLERSRELVFTTFTLKRSHPLLVTPRRLANQQTENQYFQKIRSRATEEMRVT